MTFTPARPFRVIRGAAANHKTIDYATLAARNTAAVKWANKDGEYVLTELWSADHPQDDLNRGWACDGQVYPAGQEPTPAPPSVRGPASLIRVGDTVTVFAHPVGTVTTGSPTGGRDYTGKVRLVVPLTYGGASIYRLTLADSDSVEWVRDAIGTAVTVWHEFHDARPCDCPEFEQDEDENYVHNCCKDCGRDIFDGGSDGWLHADVWDLTPAPGADDPTDDDRSVDGIRCRTCEAPDGKHYADCTEPEEGTPAALVMSWRAAADEIDPDGTLRTLDIDSPEGLEAATWARAADELAHALGLEPSDV